MEIRVGQGYDVHRLVRGRPLILGGVTIEHETGLDGHSDADVLAHAITDAILGAAAMGDIGQHFPPDQEQWKDADSLKLLHVVMKLVRANGWELSNVDSTIIAERPKIGPYSEAMREKLAQALGVKKEAVAVKATTNEKLGFLGREEGIAALATALLIRKASS